MQRLLKDGIHVMWEGTIVYLVFYSFLFSFVNFIAYCLNCLSGPSVSLYVGLYRVMSISKCLSHVQDPERKVEIFLVLFFSATLTKFFFTFIKDNSACNSAPNSSPSSPLNSNSNINNSSTTGNSIAAKVGLLPGHSSLSEVGGLNIYSQYSTLLNLETDLCKYH